MAFSAANILLGVPTETARKQGVVVLAVAWGVAAARRKSWSP
jgi:hypothetical protein